MQNGIFFLCASDDKEGLIYDFKKIEKSNALFFCVYETRDFPSFELENALSNFFIAFVPFTDISTIFEPHRARERNVSSRCVMQR